VPKKFDKTKKEKTYKTYKIRGAEEIYSSALKEVLKDFLKQNCNGTIL